MSPKRAHNLENLLHPEGVGLPVDAPPSNHGHTPAAWFLTIFFIVGVLIAGLGLPFNSTPMVVIGAIITAIGCVGGMLLSATGRGQVHAARK